MKTLAFGMMEATARGDLDAVRDFYAPDATLWMNVTGRTLPVDEHFQSVKGMLGRVGNVRYEDIRVTPFEGGYAQQHRVRGDLPNGGAIVMDICFVVQVRDGKIAHRDEYTDSAALAVLRG